jgi:hypothetical protein
LNQVFWNGLNRTDAVANPVGSASYIIDVSGSTYRMINQTTGQVDYSSTNATKVGQYAMANASLNGGGTIYWKAGNYLDIHLIVLPTYDNIILQGEGDATNLSQSVNTVDLISLAGTASDYVEGVVIRDFHLQGAGTTHGSQCGIHMTYTKSCLIEHNYLSGMMSYTGTGHYGSICLMYYNYNNTITENTIEGGTWEGIAFGGGGTFNTISFNHIMNTADNGIDLNGAVDFYETHNNHIIGNIIVNTGRDGIQFDGAYRDTIENNIVIGVANSGISLGARGTLVCNNYVDGGPSRNTNVGILLSWSTSGLTGDNQIVGNKVANCSDTGIFVEKNLNCSVDTNTVKGCTNGITIYAYSNFTSLTGNNIQSGSGYHVAKAIWLYNVSCVQVTGGIINDADYGVYLQICNYSSLSGITIYDIDGRPIIESTTGGTCDYNSCFSCSFIKYTNGPTWGVAGNDLPTTANLATYNLHVQTPVGI